MEIKYFIPIDVMQKTKEFLVEQGKKGNEAYVLWKGIQQNSSNYVVTGIIIPEQKASHTAFGYSFDLSEESIERVIKSLRQTNEMGLCQVHSHPGNSSKHSQRDDTLSLLGRKGAISIVLPYFGNVDFTDFSSTTVHVLVGVNKWEVLSIEQVKKILIIMR